ncbi:MAG: hypothetical protein R6U55_14640 [Desulfovermiculus sp.]
MKLVDVFVCHCPARIIQVRRKQILRAIQWKFMLLVWIPACAGMTD